METANVSVTIEELAAWLRAQKQVTLISHVSPDGDTLGSALALKFALVQVGIDAIVRCVDSVPDFLRFMPGTEEISAPTAADLLRPVLYVDVSEPKRVRNAWPLAHDDCAQIDHHGTNTMFARLNIVDAKASSTGEIALKLIDALGALINQDIALCLYTAIATDTGNFSFSNTTACALRAVVRCMEAGFAFGEANRLLFRLRSVARTKMLGAIISAMETAHSGEIAYTRITPEMLAHANATSSDCEGAINYLVEMQGVRVAFTVETRANGTKCSFRSDGSVDVAALALRFGGGGHMCAAGATIECGQDDAVRQILHEIEQMMQ